MQLPVKPPSDPSPVRRGVPSNASSGGSIAQAPNDVLDTIREAISSGDENAARELYKSFSSDYNLPSFENMADEVYSAQKAIMDSVKEESSQVKRADYQEIIDNMKKLLQKKGEARNSAGTLYREHIPADVFGQSSDEVADALGMSESDLMKAIPLPKWKSYSLSAEV